MSSIESFLTSVEKRLEAATPGSLGRNFMNYIEEWPDGKRHKTVVAHGPRYKADESGIAACGHDMELMFHAKSDLEKAVKALRVITKAAESVLWVDECRCDEGYTSRGKHEPNSKCGDLDDLRDALKEIESILGEK